MLKSMEKFKFSYCRDLTKEGLTKPRNLLKIMLECIKKRFEDFPVQPDFFDTYCVLVDGGNVYPPRGHGLGMANELTTLM
jgi:hypothetical protein